MTILKDIMALKNDYEKKEGKAPTKLFLPREKENQLIPLKNSDIVGGPRKKYEKGIYGMEVVWDADEFKVE